MEKRFIVLIDFSANAINLLKYASDWGKQVNAALLLVHQTVALTPAFADSESKASIVQNTNEEALQQLKALAQEVVAPGVPVSFQVSEQPVHLLLPPLAEAPFEQLIFVGLKGTEVVKQLLIGSVALGIIDNTTHTVVAMPKEIDHFSHKKIFVGVTEEYPLNILALNNFLHFIDPEGTSITFFYLSKPQEKTEGIKKQLSDLAALFNSRFETDFAIYEGSNPFEDIKQVINNRIEEILVVQKGSRLFLDHVLRKFLINELVYEGQTPLVVLP